MTSAASNKALKSDIIKVLNMSDIYVGIPNIFFPVMLLFISSR